MKIYRIHRQQRLAVGQAEAWAFFSSPNYLNSITPDFFHVEITSPVPDDIYAGLLISYRMTAVFGLPMSWLSEVSQCDQPRRFVYQQRVGPFNFWSHEVALNEIPGGVLLEDIVFYTMRWGWLGRLLHGLLIAEKLQRIFDTRREYLQAKWGVVDI
ncbi:SRPBCC family protein [Methylomonas sp. 2BW1-5-20]|uniref:SRPBCC family protein n=1 Tax=Methylomonas sp. 2BW1-5-20 TaxID=3376686 RepID=UPI00404F0EF5